jgi:hypothetical protein
MAGKKFLVIAMVALAVALLVFVSAASGAAQAEFVLINATSQWLTLYIDGRKSVSVPPGDRGVDLIAVGNHTFRVVTPDGRYATHQGYVPPEGKTWTVTEK